MKIWKIETLQYEYCIEMCQKYCSFMYRYTIGFYAALAADKNISKIDTSTVL